MGITPFWDNFGRTHPLNPNLGWIGFQGDLAQKAVGPPDEKLHLKERFEKTL